MHEPYTDEHHDAEIAIIGLRGRFPGAPDIERLWDNLCHGVEAMTTFSDEELLAAAVAPDLLQNPDYVKAGMILADVELFDAAFFDYSPREVTITDPQQRLFLECAWEALEAAAYDAATYPGLIGVFAGTSQSKYLLHHLLPSREQLPWVSDFQLMLGNDKDYLPTRVSYKLNLRGPSLNVQTACSTSLVAVHLACQSLLNGECDMALAGGVSIHVPQTRGHLYREGGINSPDGHCRPFDSQAQGTIGGNGVALVVLKRLTDAVAEGDTIHAIIKGSAINNDGWSKVGYTAPSVEGQATAIADAIALAQIDPATITYVETHGTATPLGDPIEIAALTQAFRSVGVTGNNVCALGALKANIGHLDAAAGVAGLIKTVLALKHRQLPPQPHFTAPNPQIDFGQTPFYVNTQLTDWRSQGPRRAGVSSFGIGGTNAHVILEEAPPAPPADPARPAQLLLLSAKTATALETMTDNLVAYLQHTPDVPLADVAYTLQGGRTALRHRRMVVCQNHAEAVAALTIRDQRQVLTAIHEPGNRSVVFMFPGQGAQYVNMARELYETEAVFRHHVDTCAELLRPHLQLDIRTSLYPEPEHADAAAVELMQTVLAQPALFVISYALAQLWSSWGIQPEAMIGHSVGEYVAACVAGVFSLEDALALMAARGRLMQLLPGGAMLAVSVGEADLAPLLGGELSLAAVNSPERCVVSGSNEAIHTLTRQLEAQGIPCRRLHTSHAFHSPMMAPILEPFIRQVEKVKRHPPTIPFMSNITGTWITAAEATDPRYWADQLRQPVRFADGVRQLSQEPSRIFLEVGPGNTLTSLVRPQIGSSLAVASSRHPQEAQQGDVAYLWHTVGRLWLAGVPVNWAGVYREQRRTRLSLPTYPFERQRYWLDVRPVAKPVDRPQPTPFTGDKTMPYAPVLPDRQDELLRQVQALFANLLGTAPTQVAPDATFFELGADSLMLIQGSQALEKAFAVKIPFRLLLEELATSTAVAAHLDHMLPADAFRPTPQTQPATLPSLSNGISAPSKGTRPLPATTGAPIAPVSSNLEQIIQQQLHLMAEQLALLRQPGHVSEDPIITHGLEITQSEFAHTNAKPGNGTERPGTRGNSAFGSQPIVPLLEESPQTVSLHEAGIYPDLFIPAPRRTQENHTELTLAQQAYLADFIACYTHQTQTSKRLAQTYRPVLADNRASAGFRGRWKELTYLLTTDSAQDARLHDVDGNEYIDLTMGFGVHLFGHSPAFIQKALKEQLVQNLALGAQTAQAGEVARLISQMTGVERVAFANSGTEAVMTALRLARAVTGRDKIAFFAGSYHGSFDGTLAQPGTSGHQHETIPLAPGIPASVVTDTLVLEYNTQEALEQIRLRGRELAAILVEPVQSRRPDIQPRAFLQELRRLADETGAALIFDEIITGFRVHPGGAQAVFGVKADLVTYGKVIGGGLPLGLIAGKRAYLDAIDGGLWQFGDDSFPVVDQTFFAGTFCKHPLSMATTLATLRHLQNEGPALQERLNQQTATLAQRLNTLFRQHQVPLQVVTFGSLFRFLHPRDLQFADLFFYLLRHKGLYIWEGRTCFLSTAHTAQDIEAIIQVVTASVTEMQKNGFFPGSTPPHLNGHYPMSAHYLANGKTAPQDTSPDLPQTLPLTDNQQQLWFLTQVGDEASRAYNEAVALHLEGPLDVVVLQQALQTIVDRHEALRTTFSANEAVQTIQAQMKLELPLVEASSLHQTATEAATHAWLREQIETPFDLMSGPPLRARLLRQAGDEHLLLLVVHHLAADGWSLGVMLRDAAAHYTALCQHAPLSQTAPVPFRHYATWLTEQNRTQDAAASYWLARFAGSLPVLTLPADYPRPALQTYKGQRQSLLIPAALAQRLKSQSQQQRTTLYTTLLAAYQLLLHRLSGQDDVIVGIPAAGQAFMGQDNLVGHCVNFLPLRSQLEGNPSFTDYLRDTQQELLNATSHQTYPLHRLIKQLNLSRDPGRPPLVTATFNLDQDLTPSLSFAGLTVAPASLPVTSTKFDLSLNVVATTDGLHLDCDYNCDLFSAVTIQRWLNHFHLLLKAISTAPTTGVWQLPLLTPVEQQQMFNLWPMTRYPQDQTLPHLFEQQVRRTPKSIALTGQDWSFTYDQLNRQANQLAYQLQALGVGPNTLVALYLERSPELILAILATLKAGAAYVPIDPAYPTERVAYILEDTQALVLLTQPDLQKNLPRWPACQVLCLERDGRNDAGGREDNLTIPVAAEDTAYVIYTSGSTGQPKGVMVSHANVMRLFTATDAWFHFQAQDVWTLFHSYAFDFSVWEMWGALLYGGRLVIVPYWISRSPEAFYELLAREQVTVLNQTPSAFRQLIQAEEAAANPHTLALRLVIFGGEALELQSLRPWFDRHGDTRPQLVNMYGITETTVHVTYRPLTLADLDAGQGSVIGRPIPDLCLYLLDTYGQPVPPGVTGELYVGGAGVSKGYLNRPELTAERFMRHSELGRIKDEGRSNSHFSLPDSACLIYKTGDLGRLLVNGDIEYLGRIDQQVKIRGFRIELGEIEATLNRHPAVQTSIVLAWGADRKDKRLVAYVVTTQPSPGVDGLRHFLKQKLPDYMVPAAFVFLEALPLTTNGKVDRRALPEPEANRTPSGQIFVAPRNPAEEALATVWAEVLGVVQVGVNDNFFDLGGDSLRTVQVRALAKARGYDFSLLHLFQHPTVAELALHLGQAEEVEPDAAAPFSLINEVDRIRLPEDVIDAYPLARTQAGMLFRSQYDANSTVYHNVNTLHLRGPFDPDKLRLALQHLIERHPLLRTSFHLHGYSQPLQLVHRQVTPPLQVDDWQPLTTEAQEEAVADWIKTEQQNKFDWTRPPLIRFHVHRRTVNTWQFGWTEHHVILDGWSVESLLAELFQEYVSLLQGKPLAIASPQSLYRDFVAQEQVSLADEEIRHYWRRQLAGATATELPRPAAAPAQADIRSHVLPLGETLTTALRRVAQQLGVPLKSVMLAAHIRVMGLISGQTDVVTGVTVHGRLEEPDGDRALGVFVNVVPLRLALRPQTWNEFIQTVFAAEQDLLPHRRYPLAEIQTLVGQDALFTTTFNFLHFHVYRDVLALEEIELLDQHSVLETDLPFVAHCLVSAKDGSMRLHFDYQTQILNRSQVEAIGTYYQAVLAAMTTDPAGYHHLCSLLPEGEQRQLLRTWNETTKPIVQNTVPEQVLRQAVYAPDALALSDGLSQLTYDDLNRQANQLAHYLQSLGVGPETPVALALDRSPELVVAALAVLKAGGAYVPLDLNAPPERLTYMLVDAQTPLVISQEPLLFNLPPSLFNCVLMREGPTIATFPDDDPAVIIIPDNLAYIIYTSGSTGRPKGVAVTHGGLMNLVAWHRRVYGIAAADRATLIASPAFDASVWEIWPYLVSGASLSIPDENTQMLPHRLPGWLAEQAITVTFLPTPLAEAMLSETWPTESALRLLLTGGDRLHHIPSANHPFTLVNNYGPTENSVVTTWTPVSATTVPIPPPIGRPVDNVQVFVLDVYLQPVPLGTPGELYLAGHSLARGYYHRPDLTAERFIPHPFATVPGTRLYRTGDLVRYLPDGQLEFLGRADNQVKIRGFRVELGEIEVILAQHAAACDVVVLPTSQGDQLVAFVVSADPAPSALPDQLAAFAQDHLPNYMIPARFICLDALPLTLNGKVDRLALLAMATDYAAANETCVAPRTVVEEGLVAIWQEVLGLEQVGVFDDFFALGGHSLKATQVTTRLYDNWQLDLPLRTLFDHPTIAALAEVIEEIFVQEMER